MTPKIIAVDFDGTLCVHEYPSIGSPHLDVINKLKLEKENGAKLILWTCREGALLDEAVEWCLSYGVQFDSVNDNIPELVNKFNNNSRKVCASEYWDDRAVRIFSKGCDDYV